MPTFVDGAARKRDHPNEMIDFIAQPLPSCLPSVFDRTCRSILPPDLDLALPLTPFHRVNSSKARRPSRESVEGIEDRSPVDWPARSGQETGRKDGRRLRLPARPATATLRSGLILPATTDALTNESDPNKTPLVFVACGSFSPVTFLHLRMFEMARDHARLNTSCEVVGGYMSFVNDAYKKAGLAPAVHRYNMCRLACRKTSDWLMVDAWEARQKVYVPTARVLDHFEQELNGKNKGVEVSGGKEGERRPIKIVLLAGSDLIQTMSEPGVWSEKDVRLLPLRCLVHTADLGASCDTSSASSGPTSSNGPSPRSTGLSSPTRPARRSTSTATTSSSSPRSSATTSPRPKSGCSSKRA